jgi:hypothetical protein
VPALLDASRQHHAAAPTSADQVTVEAGEARYHLSGPPSQTFAVTDADLPVLAPGLLAGVEWVYVSGFDVETRHLLLANEWARAYRPDALAGLADRALESAKAAYKAYVKSSSRETLKALADLRKAVIEECAWRRHARRHRGPVHHRLSCQSGRRLDPTAALSCGSEQHADGRNVSVHFGAYPRYA